MNSGNQSRGSKAPSGRISSAVPGGGGVEPNRPLGSGRACVPNGLCKASFIEWPAVGIHEVVLVDFPNEPSKGLVL